MLDGRRGSADTRRASLQALRDTLRDDMTNAELANRACAVADAHPHWLVADLEVELYRQGRRDVCAYLWAARHTSRAQRDVQFVPSQSLRDELERMDLSEAQVVALYGNSTDALVAKALAHPRAAKEVSEYTMLANERGRSLSLGSVTPEKDWDRVYRELVPGERAWSVRDQADTLASEEIRDLRGNLQVVDLDGPLGDKMRQACESAASLASSRSVTVDAAFMHQLRMAMSEQPPGDFVACATKAYVVRARALA